MIRNPAMAATMGMSVVLVGKLSAPTDENCKM